MKFSLALVLLVLASPAQVRAATVQEIKPGETFLRFQTQTHDLGAITFTRTQLIYPEGIWAPTEKQPATSIHPATRTYEVRDGYFIQAASTLYKTDRVGTLRFKREAPAHGGFSLGDGWFGLHEYSAEYKQAHYRLFDSAGKQVFSLPLEHWTYSARPTANLKRVWVFRSVDMDGYSQAGPWVYDVASGKLLDKCSLVFNMMFSGAAYLADGSMVGQIQAKDKNLEMVRLSHDGHILWRRSSLGRIAESTPIHDFFLIYANRTEKQADATREIQQALVLNRDGAIVFKSDENSSSIAYLTTDKRHLIVRPARITDVNAAEQSVYELDDFRLLGKAHGLIQTSSVSPDGKKVFGLYWESKPIEPTQTPQGAQPRFLYTQTFIATDLKNGRELARVKLPFESNDASAVYLRSIKALDNETARCFLGSEIWLIRLKKGAAS